VQITPPSSPEAEWVKVLGNGLITIPKAMRKKAGIKEGDVAKATLVGNKIIIEPRASVQDYRVFTDEQVAQWLKDDTLSPEELAQLGDLFDDVP
jgi:AbrB family looped-hinge helix DNA binding protein